MTVADEGAGPTMCSGQAHSQATFPLCHEPGCQTSLSCTISFAEHRKRSWSSLFPHLLGAYPCEHAGINLGAHTRPVGTFGKYTVAERSFSYGILCGSVVTGSPVQECLLHCYTC